MLCGAGAFYCSCSPQLFDSDCLFEVRGKPTVAELYRPAVLCDLRESVVRTEHRRDSDPHACLQFHGRSRPGDLVRDVRLHVKLLADPVPAIAVNDVEVVLLGDWLTR